MVPFYNVAPLPPSNNVGIQFEKASTKVFFYFFFRGDKCNSVLKGLNRQLERLVFCLSSVGIPHSRVHSNEELLLGVIRNMSVYCCRSPAALIWDACGPFPLHCRSHGFPRGQISAHSPGSFIFRRHWSCNDLIFTDPQQHNADLQLSSELKSVWLHKRFL